VTAAGSIGKIVLTGRSERADITGDIVAQGGGIDRIYITNGDLTGNVTAQAGGIGKIYLRGGSALAGNTIYAAGDIKSLDIRYGRLEADVVAEGGVGSFKLTGGNLTGDVTVGADVKSVKIASDVVGSTVWIGGFVKSFKATRLTNAVVSSLFGFDKFYVYGSVTNSQIVGGYNAATGELHSAFIDRLKVGGNWTDSVVAVGVDPVDGDYLTLGDNLPAPGVSWLDDMRLDGNLAGTNLVIADTSTGETPAGMPTAVVDTPAPPLSADPAERFADETKVIGGLTFQLKGPGEGSYDPDTGRIILNGTTDKTKLTVTNAGTAAQVELLAGDDDSLSQLRFNGNIVLGDATFDGRIKKFYVGTAANGAVWQLLGDVSRAVTAGIGNATIVTGQIERWDMEGGFGGGSLTADAITKKMTIGGGLAAPISIVAGPLERLTVEGSVTAEITASAGIGRLSTGSVRADVTVESGDLDRMTVYGDLDANVDVQAGYLGRLEIRDGTFASPLEDKAIRARDGIGRYYVKGGISHGLIGTDGAIEKIYVRGGALRSRVYAGNGIGRVTVDALEDALLASGNDIGKVTIRGHMTRSDVVAGFDPGDAGYDAAHGGDAANLRFDGRTYPSAWQTAGNVDVHKGGEIKYVRIGGHMTDSSIAAGVGPGADGWFGTSDDQVRGYGYVGKVSLSGNVATSGDPTQHFGIYAASATPSFSGAGLAQPPSNFSIGTQASSSGSPRIVKVEVADSELEVFFDHDIDFSTINTAQIDPSRPTTFSLVVSRNSTFDASEPDDVCITDDVPVAITYNSATHSVLLSLTHQTWNTLNLGTHYRLTLDGSVVADRRGNLIDGEFNYAFPTGDGFAGGDFVYRFIHGDAGDTEATATELNDGNPVLVRNQVLTIEGEIGDNLVGDPSWDVDVYMLSVSRGDVLYYYSPNAIVYHTASAPGLLVDAGSGTGYRVLDEGEVYLWVDSLDPYTWVGSLEGPYTLEVLLFNDGNSNFSFDDATQVATPLTWLDNLAEPNADLQEITAPDDVDLYDLGWLSAGTELTLNLETVLVGSPLTPKMAVFNSNGELVGRIIFGDEVEGSDAGGVASAITVNESVLVVQADRYYVAVAGLGFNEEFDPLRPDFGLADMGRYRLTVVQEPVQIPTSPVQTVYLNFTGGVAAFLSDMTIAFGGPVDVYQEPLSATQFGYDTGDTQAMLNDIVDTVETIYTDPVDGAGLTRIEFTTVRPLNGPYSSVYVGGNIAPIMGLVGLAEQIDAHNRELTDSAVVWGGEIASYYSAAQGYSLAEVSKVVGNVIAHELGHILGLNHVQRALDDNWLMGYGDQTKDLVLTSHAPLMTTPSYEFLIGYQNSVASLWPVA